MISDIIISCIYSSSIRHIYSSTYFGLFLYFLFIPDQDDVSIRRAVYRRVGCFFLFCVVYTQRCAGIITEWRCAGSFSLIRLQWVLNNFFEHVPFQHRKILLYIFHYSLSFRIFEDRTISKGFGTRNHGFRDYWCFWRILWVAFLQRIASVSGDKNQMVFGFLSHGDGRRRRGIGCDFFAVHGPGQEVLSAHPWRHWTLWTSWKQCGAEDWTSGGKQCGAEKQIHAPVSGKAVGRWKGKGNDKSIFGDVLRNDFQGQGRSPGGGN